MSIRRRKASREKDLTGRYLSGDYEEDRMDAGERFTDRSKNAQQNKIEQTAQMRATEGSGAIDNDALPTGRVILVHSLFLQVEHETGIRLCVVRKTLTKLSHSAIVVGDLVKFRDSGTNDEQGRPEAVIELVLPRSTILTRADSFSGTEQHPIVANAEQMLIVVSLILPAVKWGLVDRMLVAAGSGGLVPIVCLNKVDLSDSSEKTQKELTFARAAIAHYSTMGVRWIETSATSGYGLDDLRQALKDKTTVLAGHSGVGKSSLIAAVNPGLDIRVGEISNYTAKGRHTTTSARRYLLDIGGYVIDTPGVKMFGLWGITPDNLAAHFPDIVNGTAPEWRKDSYERIKASMKEQREH